MVIGALRSVDGIRADEGSVACDLCGTRVPTLIPDHRDNFDFPVWFLRIDFETKGGSYSLALASEKQREKEREREREKEREKGQAHSPPNNLTPRRSKTKLRYAVIPPSNRTSQLILVAC